MEWLRRILGSSSPPPDVPEEDAAPAYEERPAPGVAALLEGVRADRSHAVLDLGGAAESSLGVYARFAAHVRFVDLLSAAMSDQGARAALQTVPVEPERPYDLVFAWDVLDRLFPEDRPRLMERLVRATGPDARLHLVTESSDAETTRPRRFTLVDADRIRIEPTGPERPARRHLLPAEIERLVEPFRVVHGYTLKGGLREYVAVRNG